MYTALIKIVNVREFSTLSITAILMNIQVGVVSTEVSVVSHEVLMCV